MCKRIVPELCFFEVRKQSIRRTFPCMVRAKLRGVLLLTAALLTFAQAAQALPKVTVVSPRVAAAPLATQEEIPALTAKAEQDDMVAQTRLGRWYFTNEQQERGVKLLQKAANNGHPEAQFLCALASPPYRGIQNLDAQDSAFGAWQELLQKAAAAGYAPAAALLADDAAWRAANDDAEAQAAMLQWYRTAASLGDAQSAAKLGKMYFLGKEVEHDGVAAYTWLYLARHGFSVPVDADKEQGAASRSANYDYEPLEFLENSLSLDELRQVEAALAAWPQKLPQAASSIRPSQYKVPPTRTPELFYTPAETADLKAKAEKGDNAARARLGRAYLFGNGVLPKDAAKAQALLTQAAEAGEPEGLLGLGEIYAYGIGTTKDFAKTHALLSKAADKGHLGAQAILGAILLQSESYGAAPDTAGANRREGLARLREAAEQGFAGAMLFLAGHERSHGSKKTAAEWHERAAEAGSVKALTAWVEDAGRAHNAAEVSKRLFIYLDCQAPADRLSVRASIVMTSAELGKKLLLEQKKAADAWLKKYPKVKAESRELAAKKAAFEAVDR